MGSYHAAAPRQAPALARPIAATRIEPIVAAQDDVQTLFTRLCGERLTFAGFTRVLKRHLGSRFDDRWQAFLDGEMEAADPAEAQ